MVAAAISMQPTQKEPEALAGHMNFSNVGDSLFGDNDFNINEFIDDSQVSNSKEPYLMQPADDN